MWFTPLEDKSSLTQVPGTVVLADLNRASNVGTNQLDLKRDKSGTIILSPQPSEDPNDPLNWSLTKKWTILTIIMFGACLCASTIGPLLSASLVVMAQDFQRPLTDITLVTGYLLLAAGCSGPVVFAIACKYGKRPAFLFCSFMGLLGSIIGSATQTYQQLLAARVVQGFATCAYESLIISIVGDLFYVHERGFYASIVIFTLNSISNFSPIVCGPISDNLGWRWLFHLLVLTIGIQFVLCFLLVPETTYHRNQRYNTDGTANTNLEELAKIEHQHQETIAAGGLTKTETGTVVETSPLPVKKTFVQELKVYNGSFSDQSILAIIVAPFMCCTNLAVLWMVVMTGFITSFYVATSYVAAQIFFPPPYLLTQAQVGYTFLGPFIGGVLGTVAVGSLSDWLVIKLTKHNKGIYEPEFRLVPTVLGLLAGAGFIGFGYVTSVQGNVYLACFLWGLAIFGVTFAVVPAPSYIIDSFRDLSQEAFIAAMMLKNFVFYAYSTFVNDWTARTGPDVPFYTFGGTTFGLVLTTLIFYVWGKRYRSFWYRHNILEKLHIRTHAEA